MRSRMFRESGAERSYVILMWVDRGRNIAGPFRLRAWMRNKSGCIVFPNTLAMTGRKRKNPWGSCSRPCGLRPESLKMIGVRNLSEVFRLVGRRVFWPEQRRGEVSERLKEHAWKACSREIVTWVRIPPSPPRTVRYVAPPNRKMNS